jgi:proline dehydrogenase
VSDRLNLLFRRLILLAAMNPLVRRIVERYGMRLGAARFVAGVTLDDAVPTLRRLQDDGLHTNTTILGEHVTTEAEADAVADAYVQVLDRLHAEGLWTNVALKLTHLGLDLSEELAYANLRRVLERARELDTFIRIDMEEAPRVEPTLRLYRRARADGFDNLGTVLQSYLYRTEPDLESLYDLRPNLRFVKGAYREPPDLAMPRKADVDASYVHLVKVALDHGVYCAVATHDERIIREVLRYAERRGIGRDRFELQMLYGVRTALQRDLVAQGYKVLVATPHGPDWYAYLMRRLAERPANLLFLLRNAIRG